MKMRATEQFFPAVNYFAQVALLFVYVSKIQECNDSNEGNRAVIFCSSVYCAAQCGSKC